MIKKLCLLLILFPVLLFAANDKYTLESELTRVAQTALDSMYGQGNFVVRVQVDMTTPKYSVKYTQESNPKESKNKKKDGEEVYILPGVPALKNLSPDNLKQLPYDSVTTLTESRLKRMNVYVLVNKAFPRTQARRAKPMLVNLLGIKDGRDQIRFEYKPFYYNPSNTTQNITIIPGNESLLKIQNLFYLLMVLLMAIFIYLFIKMQDKLNGLGSGGGAPSVSVNPNLELPKGAGGSGDNSKVSISAAPKIKRYFDFILEDNVDDFIYLVKKENLNPEYVATILSFLPPEVAARVLDAVPTEEKAAIAPSLIDQRLGNRQMLDKLETKIKHAMECFVGGQKMFTNMFDLVSSDEKKKVLAILKKSNPTGFKKVRENIVIFDDIKRLQDDELKLILSEANVDLIARSLVSVDQDLYQRIVDNLTKSAKSMVTQFLELKSSSTSRKDIEAAQDYIIKVAMSLDESGKINLKAVTGGGK